MNFHVGQEFNFLVLAGILIGLPYIVWKGTPINKVAPLVVIQIMLGILMGPSVLGMILPDLFKDVPASGDVVAHFGLFGPAALSSIKGLSWLALVLFGFTTGLHFDHREIVGKGKAFSAAALASTLLPFALCFIGGMWMFQSMPGLAGNKASLWTFSIGMGIAGGVTALPVLGAILKETGVIHQQDGKLALGLATASDGLLWVLVAILNVLMAQSNQGGSGTSQIFWTVTLFFGFMAFMVGFVRPQLKKLNVKHKLHPDEQLLFQSWMKDPQRKTPKANHLGDFASTLDQFKNLNWLQRKMVIQNDLETSDIIKIGVMMVCAALATDAIGMHYLLGAFVFGAMMPKSEVLKLGTELPQHNQDESRFAFSNIKVLSKTLNDEDDSIDQAFDRTPQTHNLERVDILILEHSKGDPEGVNSHRVMYLFPSNASLTHEIEAKLLPVLGVWLLPFFFMKTGLSTQFSVGNKSIWYIFVVITVLSAIGKMVGTMLPAKGLPGYSWRDASYLGSLMQCKGLMEVVVLTILLKAGVITNLAFSGLLFMAVFTTACTKPLMLLIKPKNGHHKPYLLPTPLSLLPSPKAEAFQSVASPADGE